VRRGPGQALAGFTLIELLVAIFLLAVLSAFAYGTLSYVMKAREATQASFERSREVEGAVHQLVTDFEQLAPRPIRQPTGPEYFPALVADARSQDLVALTRGGWSNNAGLPRPTLQRVSYRFDAERGVLVRAYTNGLDVPLGATPVKRDLLTGVTKVALRFLPASSRGNSLPAGPPGTGGGNNGNNGNPPITTPPPLAADGGGWVTSWPPLNAAAVTPPPAPGLTPPNKTGSGQGNTPPVTVPPLPRERPRAVEITLELRDYGKIMRLIEVPG
jgi:general secretion pathway protein J